MFKFPSYHAGVEAPGFNWGGLLGSVQAIIPEVKKAVLLFKKKGSAGELLSPAPIQAPPVGEPAGAAPAPARNLLPFALAGGALLATVALLRRK